MSLFLQSMILLVMFILPPTIVSPLSGNQFYFPKVSLPCLTNPNYSRSWEQSFVMSQFWHSLSSQYLRFGDISSYQQSFQWWLFYLPTLWWLFLLLWDVDHTDGDFPMQLMNHSYSTELSFQRCLCLEHELPFQQSFLEPTLYLCHFLFEIFIFNKLKAW